MSYKLLVVVVLLVTYTAYCTYVFWQAAKKSRPIIDAAVPYQREDATRVRSILILGDSLAVGVGAAPQETIAAKLGTMMNANVENHAVSGARTGDLEIQLANARNKSYDLVFIQAGANDVIHFESLSDAQENMDRTLSQASAVSRHVAFLFAGNIGDAPLWPWPFSTAYRLRAHNLHARYAALATKYNAVFVDIISHGDMFSADVGRYYADDGLHLSAAGYAKWYEIIRTSLLQKWPDLQ